MRLREETALTPEAAAELAALEAALAGAPVAPEHADLADLVLALRDERPRPADDFARTLDERAAASFPREPAASRTRGGVAAGVSRWRGVAATRWRGMRAAPARRWLPAAGFAASIAVATTLALSLTGSDRDGTAGETALIGAAPSATSEPGDAGGGTTSPQTGSAAPQAAEDGARLERDSAAKSAPPVAQASPGAPSGADSSLEPEQPSAPALGAPVPAPVTPSTSPNRRVERGATLRLATTPQRLDDIASRVVRVTDGVGGFVRSSAVDSRPGLGGGATFELQIPVRRLSTALARLSALASVRSRNESSLDVTEQVEQARDRVVALKAERRSLLRQLERATSLDETTRLRARLRSVEARLDSATSVRAQLRQRTTYSAVLVEVVTEKPRDEAAGPWTPRDALGDAGRVLEVSAGVALVALAVLLPLALLALIAWPLGRAVQRRRREGALDAPRAAAAG